MEPDQWGDAGGKAAQRLTDAQRIRKRSAVPMGGAMDDNGKSFTVRNEDDCGEQDFTASCALSLLGQRGRHGARGERGS